MKVAHIFRAMEDEWNDKRPEDGVAEMPKRERMEETKRDDKENETQLNEITVGEL